MDEVPFSKEKKQNKYFAHCKRALIVTENPPPHKYIAFISHPFKSARDFLTRYPHVRKMKPVRFDMSHLTGDIYLFTHFTRLLGLRAPAHHAVTVGEAVDSPDAHSALHCSIIPSTAKPSQSPRPPADWLPFPHAGASPRRLLSFFFSASSSTELPHSPHTVYVGGIVK